MAFSADLDDAVSRLRFGVGDVAEVALLRDATYEALLLTHANNEGAALRAVASGLAAMYANQPTSVSSNGSSVTWGERISFWLRIANGEVGGTAGVAVSYGLSVPGRRSDGYTASTMLPGDGE